MANQRKQQGSSAGSHKPLLCSGAMVHHFRVMRRIGRGGMGEVYLARDTRLGRKVALKIIHRDNIASHEAVEQLNFEARATARLNHPHIVTIYEVGEHNGVPFVALEYLEGQTLRQRLREEQPGVREVLRLGLAIAKALKAAHGHQILHLDLKPENVLIPKDGRLRVVDFGLAGMMTTSNQSGETLVSSSRSVERSTDEFFEQKERGIRGSPPYMAPEQWLESSCTGATDLWSLGVILYELLTGSRPFTSPSVIELATNVVSAEPTPMVETALRATSRTVPAELSGLINRCLSKEGADRPGADETVEVLESLVYRSRGLLAEEQRPFRGLLPFSERHAGFFFGRDDEILAFLERLRHQPVLPVVGPSGAGKSSFVQAGVIPRMREQGGWMVLSLRPGNDPFRVLASRLLTGEVSTDAFGTTVGFQTRPPQQPRGKDDLDQREAALGARLKESPGELSLQLSRLAAREQCRVLLLVDQLEELCTLVQDREVQQRFMEAICGAADDPQEPVRVVFTLREDFLSRLARGAGVREALSQVTVIRSPDPEALEQLLLKPLEMVDYSFEDLQLCREMINAVEGEAAALPLLQFAAHMLWTRRDRKQQLLTRAAYEAIGGVEGALAEHADGVLEGLSSSEVMLARKILLKLVTAELTRKVVFREGLLEGLDSGAEEVLGRLIQARLISGRKSYSAQGTEPGLELVHESLIHSWKRLARWIDESREELSFVQEVSQAAELWQRRGHREEEVWQGEALQEALLTLRRCSTPLPEQAARFLEAGQQKARRRGRRKWVVVGLAICLLAAVSIFLYHQKEVAETQRQEAERQRGQARKRWSDAQREGARAAFLGGKLLEARAKLRGALEVQDSAEARALWWRLTLDQTLWTREMGATVYDVSFSPDGDTVAAACQDRVIYLFDVKTQRVRVLRGHRDQVFSLAFSPDGKQLASGTWGGTVRLWDLRSGAVRVLRGHTGGVRRLAFAPHGKQLASAAYDGTVRLWDTTSTAEPLLLRGHASQVSGLGYSPDGKRLATGGRDMTIRLWDATSGKQLQVIRGHQAGIYAVQFAPDGKLLASAGYDRSVRLWDVASGSQRALLSGHRARINDLAFSPDGKRLASAGRDRTIRLWDVASGKQQRLLSGHRDWISAVSYSPDGKYLVSAGGDRTVRLWDLTTAGSARRESGHRGPIYSVAFSPDGESLASADKAGEIWLWDARTAVTRRALRGHQGVINSVAFSPDGKSLASAGGDRTVRLWRLGSGDPARVLEGHTAGVNHVAFAPDGATLASASLDNTVRLWTLAGGGVSVLRGHRASIKEVTFSPDGELVASISNDSTVRLWDRATGNPRGQLGLASEGFSVSFSPDGKQLALSSNDGEVRLWDLRSPRSRLLRRSGDRAYHLAFHPDGKRLGIASSGGTGLVVGLAGGSTVLRGHRGEVNFITFDRAGKRAATVSDDGTLRTWAVRSGRPLWRAPLLVPGSLQLYSHLGWTALGSPRTMGQRSWHRAVAASGLRAAVAGRLLCVQTFDGALEIWDHQQDRRLVTTARPGIRQLLAMPNGCVLRTGEAALLYTRTGAFKDLAREATAVARAAGQVLVAADSRVLLFDARGRKGASHEVGVGVSALARCGGQLAVGFTDGNIEVVPLDGGRRPTHTFEGVPSSPVVRMLPGPMGSIIVGYANGLLGIWKLDSGALLHHVRLHGPVVHLVLRQGRLYAATELGDHLELDLRIFLRGYCDLVRQVWRRVPVVWDSGLPVKRKPHRKHRCYKP